MSQTPIHRRALLTAGAAGTAGLLLGRPGAATAAGAATVCIEEPFHGAVLNHRHGRQSEEGLQIQVRGEAPLGDRVSVNGAEAVRDGEKFLADVLLKQRDNEIVAVSEGRFGRHEHRVRAIWDINSRPRYRFSIDDNSFFLRDIAQKQYKSLFDCFYLQMLRDLNAKYKAKFVLNIYYTTDDGFELPQFSDRYKKEWQDNANWLKLAFHAYANEPDRPYQYAAASKLIADLDQVAEQIVRFAGEETYSPPTVIHWGMVQPTALAPLYQRGVRVLSGMFEPRGGLFDVHYFVDDDRSDYLMRHDALMDFASGIVFSKIDLVCNNVLADQIASKLEPLAQDPNHAEIMDLFTHEQYFWPFYRRYLPDHAERLDVAIRWVTERGYEPVFYHEGFLGNQG